MTGDRSDGKRLALRPAQTAARACCHWLGVGPSLHGPSTLTARLAASGLDGPSAAKNGGDGSPSRSLALLLVP